MKVKPAKINIVTGFERDHVDDFSHNMFSLSYAKYNLEGDYPRKMIQKFDNITEVDSFVLISVMCEVETLMASIQRRIAEEVLNDDEVKFFIVIGVNKFGVNEFQEYTFDERGDIVSSSGFVGNSILSDFFGVKERENLLRARILRKKRFNI